MGYNYKMANKGRELENLVDYQNKLYQNRGIANIQKISTPWQVIRKGSQIVSAFPKGKSTLDFRGTVYPRIPVSFDCKESTNEKGLPLSYIEIHQIEYIRFALSLKEISFILCYVKPLMKYYIIDGQTVVNCYDNWQINKGKRGVNYIPISKMKEIKSMHNNCSVLDYLSVAL